MPAASQVDPIGPFLLGDGVFLLGAERAFRVDPGAPALDKVYFSFATMAPSGWHAVALPGALALSAEAALLPVLGHGIRGMAVALARAAARGVPVRLIQAHLPWDGGSCGRIKLYLQSCRGAAGQIDMATTHQQLGFAQSPVLPFGGSVELYGVLWPSCNVIEAYGRSSTRGELPREVSACIEAIDGRHSMDALDTNGVRTWYFDTPDLSIGDGVAALRPLLAFTDPARARLDAYANAGWTWSILVVQVIPRRGLLMVPDIAHPAPGGASFTA